MESERQQRIKDLELKIRETKSFLQELENQKEILLAAEEIDKSRSKREFPQTAEKINGIAI